MAAPKNNGRANITVKGAREHNLKNIDVQIPRETLTVITGLSGSGKSSLAFDTIYAEGQRRYVESLSAYARQFLELSGKPDVDSIEGLSPAISIEQKTTSKNPRSTVGTVTEVHDYLRLLYARIGKPHCVNCKTPISGQTAQQIVEQVTTLEEGTKVSILAPIVRGRKGEYKRELGELRRDGFSRVRVDGEDYMLADDDITMDKQKKHDIDVYVDRLVIKAGLKTRVSDSVETALKRSDGYVRLVFASGEEKLLSEKFACLTCGFSFPEIEPRMFSFNNPAGACPTCTGLGERMFFDPDLVVPDESKTLAEGVIAPWAKGFSAYYMGLVEGVAKHYKQKMNVPWKKLPEAFRKKLMYGTGEEEVAFQFQGDDSSYKFKKPFEGVMNTLERRYKESESDSVREDAEKFMSRTPCEACKGARLKPESLSVLIDGKPVSALSALSIGDALAWSSGVKLEGRDKTIAAKILKEIVDRLGFLVAVGLDYLSLDRASATLSGGEGQRIRLATQIGSALMGVLYVLDEPSIGLHQRDNQKLIAMLERLRDLGNTVLVVEHDEDTILAADHVIDMGPGAGKVGGEIVSQGTPQHIQNDPHSVTGPFLSGARRIDTPKTRRPGNGKTIRIEKASGNNLKDVSVDVPLGAFVCVTGVSGSGKSTLILDTLYRALALQLELTTPKPETHSAIRGLENIDSVIDIDQSPIGRTPRSNPATYTGLFAHIRDLFAELPEAKARGFGPGRFSFNVKGGRCESCEGDGILRIDMQFLPDTFVTCEVCQGKRYNSGTLEVLYRGKSIADVLDMTVAEAREFLGAVPYIKKKLDVLYDVGLTYIHLGQSATTLSGGEAQRIKLARELAKRSTGRTLYILDEPTTGLHFADVQKLLDVLQLLVDAGNTVLVIEHNLDVVKCADWLIDLGPEGGSRGGTILGVGTPETLAKNDKSYTGKFLAELFAREAKRPKQKAS
jgi:excinuclease ABC subunit A